jgi:hypothetical protein
MTVPLDYNQRLALRKAEATATVTTAVQKLDAPVEKQAPPDKTSATWKRLLTEAQVKLNTGLAKSMHERRGSATP